MYKSFIFDTSAISPSELDGFLNKQYKAGLELVSHSGSVFIFKVLDPSTPSQNTWGQEREFIQNNIVPGDVITARFRGFEFKLTAIPSRTGDLIFTHDMR